MRQRSEAGGRQAKEEKRPPKQEAVKIPVDPVNEVVMIAALAVLLGRDPEAARNLARAPADSFFGKGHSEQWLGLQELCRRGLSYDPATLRQVTGGAADADVVDSYIRLRPEPPPNLKHHVERVNWDRVRVEFVRGPLSAIIEAIKDPTADPAKVRAIARSLPGAFDGFGDKRYLRDPAGLIAEQDKVLTDRREGRALFPTGIDALDFYGDGDTRERGGKSVSIAGEPRLIPGLRAGDVTTISATSGGGKTTTTARIILNQFYRKRRVLYGGWEQGSGMTLELLAAMDLEWSRTDLMIGNFSAEDQVRLRDKMWELQEYIRFFELPFGRRRDEKQSNERNLNLIQEHIADWCPEVFVADLFHLAIVEHGYGLEDDALYRMKGISLEERVHTILLQQINLKNAEQRENQRPTRELIKGTGAWIGASDNVLGLFVPGLYKQVPTKTIELILLKQRYGLWPQAVECEYDPEFGYIGAGKTVGYSLSGDSDGGDDLLGAGLVRRSRFGGKKR